VTLKRRGKSPRPNAVSRNKVRGRSRRRVAVVTGSRAEYGLLQSTMKAVADHERLRLQVVVTGMHLLKKFGHTVDQVLRDGWRIDARVKMQSGDDKADDQAVGLARGVAGMAGFFEQAKTDIVVVLGDRIEAMAGALAGVTTGRFVAHLHGGDLAPGDFDDSLRHAITKLAHVHFVATASARRRVIRMGESAERVHCVGAPGLDRLFELCAEVRDAGSRAGRAVIVQHASGRAASRERRTMEWILRAVREAELAADVVYPNSDRGHTGIIEAIEAHSRQSENGSIQVFRSLDRDSYLRLLIHADVLVGNSSSGIIEAAVAGTPAVNIGIRQRGRERSRSSVVDADESLASIRDALDRALRKRTVIGRVTTYGQGQAGKRIADLLAFVALSEDSRRKVNSY